MDRASGVIVLLLAMVVACGQASDADIRGSAVTMVSVLPTASPDIPPTYDLAAILTSPAPAALRDLRQPDDRDAIRDVFEQLPVDIGSEPRTTVDHPLPLELMVVPYGTDGLMGIGASESGDETAANRIAHYLFADDGTIGGRDGDLFWVRYQSQGAFRINWGTANGHWVFQAFAPTVEQLELLIDAYGNAANESVSS